MLLSTQLLETAAMCRECAKQFSSKGMEAEAMHAAIEDHLHANPGHVVIGTGLHRVIYKEEVCIAH